jgi:hypothetical protein
LDPLQSLKKSPTVAGSHQYDVHTKRITILYFLWNTFLNF